MIRHSIKRSHRRQKRHGSEIPGILHCRVDKTVVCSLRAHMPCKITLCFWDLHGEHATVPSNWKCSTIPANSILYWCKNLGLHRDHLVKSITYYAFSPTPRKCYKTTKVMKLQSSGLTLSGRRRIILEGARSFLSSKCLLEHCNQSWSSWNMAEVAGLLTMMWQSAELPVIEIYLRFTGLLTLIPIPGRVREVFEAFVANCQ